MQHQYHPVFEISNIRASSEHHRQLRPLSDCLRDMGTIDLWYHSRNLRTTYMYSLVKHKQRHHCQWHPKSGCCLRDLLYCRCEFDILQASVCDVSDVTLRSTYKYSNVVTHAKVSSAASSVSLLLETFAMLQMLVCYVSYFILCQWHPASAGCLRDLLCCRHEFWHFADVCLLYCRC